MAVSTQDIVNFLNTNPGMSDAEIAAAMAQYGVSPSQMAQATGLSEGEVTARLAQVVEPNQATLFGDTYVQPVYTQIGAGENYEQGPLENVITYKAGENQVGGNVNWFDPTGAFQQTTKQQEVNANQDFLKFLAGSAVLFGGLGGGFDGLFGGGADAAAAAADADIAGGLIPEFGTNAAYDAFMSGAMTPAAMTALEELIAANPEIIGSGALLTDAAAGITPTGLFPSGTTTAVTTPTTTTTPVTPAVTPTTSTVTSVTPTTPTVTPTFDPTKFLTPSVISSLLAVPALSKYVTSQTGSTTPTSTNFVAPTQGVPLNSQDYYNTIQQNYNQLMPNVPRDVATPLAAWYNSQYGA